VEDRTELDEYTKLMEKIPQHWTKQVVQEESKRRSWRTMVRITNFPATTMANMQRTLEKKIAEPIDKIVPSTQGVIVHVKGEHIGLKLLALNGARWGDKLLKITKVDMVMTADEILDFITNRLKDEDRVKQFRKNCESVVNVIQNTPSAQPRTETPTSNPERGRSHSPGNRKGYKGKGKGGKNRSRSGDRWNNGGRGRPSQQGNATPQPSTWVERTPSSDGRKGGGKGNGLNKTFTKDDSNAPWAFGCAYCCINDRTWNTHPTRECYNQRLRPLHCWHCFTTNRIWWNHTTTECNLRDKPTGKGGKGQPKGNQPDPSGGTAPLTKV